MIFRRYKKIRNYSVVVEVWKLIVGRNEKKKEKKRTG
jgi:hypothetical protein